MFSLRYGQNSEMHLDLPADALLGPVRAGDDGELEDPLLAARQALRQPLGFPPLREAAVPGDKVVIALETGVPRADCLCAGAIESLLEAGGQASDFTILRTQADVDAGLPDPRGRFPPEIAAAVRLAIHQPNDRSQISYLGLTSEQHDVHLNRLLCDADLVLPIGTVRGGKKSSPARSLFPTFAGNPPSSGKQAAAKKQADTPPADTDEADNVAWMLGVQCLLQAVPGANGGICAVLAGTAGELKQVARRRYRAAWERKAAARADLVIAAISGGSWDQTWDNVGRAVREASKLVADGGAIAVCCGLSTPPSDALRLACQADDPHSVLRRLRKASAPDLAVATRLVRAREMTHIYLLSPLDETAVEELGMAAASGPDDIARLAARSESCLVLADAQHVLAVAEGDD
ncbi:MAG: lactate racemase domain-containing protein [Pirellulales bacterium]